MEACCLPFRTSFSNVSPQFRQQYSKIGIEKTSFVYRFTSRKKVAKKNIDVRILSTFSENMSDMIRLGRGKILNPMRNYSVDGGK